MLVDETMTDQRGLSEWWSEESEYLFQRIERWAALARGYNRLRNIKFQQEFEDDYSKTSKLTRSPDERRKINCCGSFNYQSNSKLDSTCLETYRYDHSIYFKTIGDIRKSKSRENVKVNEEDEEQEQIEWDIKTAANNSNNNPTSDDQINNNYNYPIVSSCGLKEPREQSMTPILSFRTMKRSPKVVRRPLVCGENNVSWPGVLLTYTPNYVDPALASANNRVVVNVKS